MTILVTAANGNQGKFLIPRLIAAGCSVRACVRSEDSAAVLRAAGADVLVGDLSDSAAMASAMDGVEKVYYIGPALHPQERSMGFSAVDAAKTSGVKHFVFSSVLHAITTDLIQHEIKRDIEEHLLSSDLEFTILQPTNYMLPIRLKPVFERGVFRLSWSLERYQSLVYVGDIAEVAAMVLSDSEHHAGATYELASPGRYNAYDLARICSEVVGQEIATEEISPHTFLSEVLGDLERFPYQARVSRAIGARYSTHDFIGNPNVLTWLLGRTPTTFGQFVRLQYEAYREALGVQA